MTIPRIDLQIRHLNEKLDNIEMAGVYCAMQREFTVVVDCRTKLIVAVIEARSENVEKFLVASPNAYGFDNGATCFVLCNRTHCVNTRTMWTHIPKHSLFVPPRRDTVLSSTAC